MASTLRNAAASYAAKGYHVIPIRPGAKVPLTEHGVHDATTEDVQIGTWWGRWPRAGVGIACGPSRLLVVDLDGADAVTAWQGLRREHGDGTVTATVRTGRGWHLWWRLPAGIEVGNSAGRLGPGIDTRGGGGYVLAPPTVHPSGVVYVWHGQYPVREAPAWLVEALTEGPDAPFHVKQDATVVALQGYLRAAVEGEVQRIMDAQEGARNHTLVQAAFSLGQLLHSGLNAAAATEALTLAGQAVGLPAGEVARTVASGLRAGEATPRVARQMATR